MKDLTSPGRPISRRNFISALGWTLAGAMLTPASACTPAAREPFFSISLAQWSLHRMLRSGELDNLAFPAYAREKFGIDAVEYVNQFFIDRAEDMDYLSELRTRAGDAGVSSQLIMCDLEGPLAHTDPDERRTAVENHYKWVDAAAYLGCHSIRVNAAGNGSRQAVADAAVQGLGALTEYAAGANINVLVENHGGWSSDGAWLAGVMEQVGHPRCGTLPDFGNFRISAEERYDRYRGVEELMPYARAVSAKSYDFDEEGNETTIDYPRMLRIIRDAGYTGHIGIEYEGSRLSETEGIRATKQLLINAEQAIGEED
ncbi:MAG: sugar phosphate isomerase/epimerase family protein [Balneolaceae bacterium]|nr:sugar phosphate isomerase/epimerase family protein [Balneolaceae bacterium]